MNCNLLLRWKNIDEFLFICGFNQLRGFEHIKGVIVEPRPLDMERDFVTATMKKKRHQLLKYYKVTWHSC